MRVDVETFHGRPGCGQAIGGLEVRRVASGPEQHKILVELIERHLPANGTQALELQLCILLVFHGLLGGARFGDPHQDRRKTERSHRIRAYGLGQRAYRYRIVELALSEVRKGSFEEFHQRRERLGTNDGLHLSHRYRRSTLDLATQNHSAPELIAIGRKRPGGALIVANDVVAGLARGRRRAASAPAPADGARAAARGPVADVHDVGLPLGHAGDPQVASARHAAAFVEPQARQAGQEGTAQSGSP